MIFNVHSSHKLTYLHVSILLEIESRIRYENSY